MGVPTGVPLLPIAWARPWDAELKESLGLHSGQTAHNLSKSPALGTWKDWRSPVYGAGCRQVAPNLELL